MIVGLEMYFTVWVVISLLTVIICLAVSQRQFVDAVNSKLTVWGSRERGVKKRSRRRKRYERERERVEERGTEFVTATLLVLFKKFQKYNSR